MGRHGVRGLWGYGIPNWNSISPAGIRSRMLKADEVASPTEEEIMGILSELPFFDARHSLRLFSFLHFVAFQEPADLTPQNFLFLLASFFLRCVWC